MALSNVSLSAGDQGNTVGYRASHGDLTPSASALAMVSGDSFLVARPEATHLGPREAVRLSVRIENRRLTGGGRSLTRFIKGREPDSRNRSRQARFSPYPVPGVKLDLLRSVLQQRLIALGGVIAARISA
uniref:Chromosome 11 open reading frame 71 n=1 Tax=Prolemur simus TaxID=1328070 RepID=A0A8C9AI84_PROSS